MMMDVLEKVAHWRSSCICINTRGSAQVRGLLLIGHSGLPCI